MTNFNFNSDTSDEFSIDTPTIIHPKQFLIKGIYFEVVSFRPLEEEDAAEIARKYFENRKFAKSHKGKVISVVTLYGLEDEEDS